MRVHWTENAVNHLDAIYRYIEQTSPLYAKRMVDRITQKSIQIGEHPYAGREVPEYQQERVREVFEKPYRVIYYIKDDQIDVLAVIHGAMNVLGNQQ